MMKGDKKKILERPMQTYTTICYILFKIEHLYHELIPKKNHQIDIAMRSRREEAMINDRES